VATLVEAAVVAAFPHVVSEPEVRARKGCAVAITEESRYQLFQRLEEMLGREGVSTLMELLPPVGWADVATKRDVDQLRVALDSRIDALDAKIDAKVERLEVGLRAEMFREQRNQTLAIIGANTTITALLLAAFQLL
jgi:hypothetical protein